MSQLSQYLITASLSYGDFLLTISQTLSRSLGGPCTYFHLYLTFTYSTAKYLSPNPLNPTLTFLSQRQISQLNPTSYHRDLSRTMSESAQPVGDEVEDLNL